MSVSQTFSIHFLCPSYLFNAKMDQVHLWLPGLSWLRSHVQEMVRFSQFQHRIGIRAIKIVDLQERIVVVTGWSVCLLETLKLLR